MDWLSKITGNAGTTMTTVIEGKAVSVYCSRRAGKELARRKSPLFVEIELAFACIARKAIHFHESPRSTGVIMLCDHLALQLTSRFADGGESGSAHTSPAQPGPHQFLPKWIRLDYRNDGWRGEYGF